MPRSAARSRASRYPSKYRCRSFRQSSAAEAEEAELWRKRQRMLDRPAISLNAAKLDSTGKATDEILDLDALRTALRQARRIALEAPGGGGKTTTRSYSSRAQRQTIPGFHSSSISQPGFMPVPIFSNPSRRGPAFRARNITATELASLAQRIHFSFLLNGWNEIAEVHSPNAIATLDALDRDFPAAGIVVATRTHHVSPPLHGAIRAKLLDVTRQQRTEYLRRVLDERAEELRLQIVGNQVLDALTRTPLILADVVTIFQSNTPVPNTRVGVLGAVVRLLKALLSPRPISSSRHWPATQSTILPILQPR